MPKKVKKIKHNNLKGNQLSGKKMTSMMESRNRRTG